jgi:hypothetical protein
MDFRLDAGKRAEFEKCLKVVDASQVQRLLLEAGKQVAASKPSVAGKSNSDIANSDAGRCTVSLAQTISSPDALGIGVSSLPPETSDLSPRVLVAVRSQQRKASRSEIANKNAGCDGVSIISKVTISGGSNAAKNSEPSPLSL